MPVFEICYTWEQKLYIEAEAIGDALYFASNELDDLDVDRQDIEYNVFDVQHPEKLPEGTHIEKIASTNQ